MVRPLLDPRMGGVGQRHDLLAAAIMGAGMDREKRVERQDALERRVAQHGAVEDRLAQVAQPLAAARRVGADVAVMHRRPEQDPRQAPAVRAQAEGERQGEEIEAEEESVIGAGQPEVAAHRPPAREGGERERPQGAELALARRQRHHADAAERGERHSALERLAQGLGHDDHEREVGMLGGKDDQVLEPLQRMAFGVGLEDQDRARSGRIIARRPGHRVDSRKR